MQLDLFNPKQSKIVEQLTENLKQIDGMLAIAVGGSFARGNPSPTSDIDLGLYYRDDNPFGIDHIRALAEKVNDTENPTVTGFGDWGKWVNGGAWLTINGQRVDFLYRSVDTLQTWIDRSKAGEIELDYYQQPATGFYSYIYLREIEICKLLFDPNNILVDLKKQIRPYPPKLKEKIRADFSWMADFTLYHAENASKRGDVYTLVGCLHRTVACIVQIVYANNEQYFLSDKAIIPECMGFDDVPTAFDERITNILSNPTMDSVKELRILLSVVGRYDKRFQI